MGQARQNCRLCLHLPATGGRVVIYHGGQWLSLEAVVVEKQVVVEVESRLLLYAVPDDEYRKDAQGGRSVESDQIPG